MLGKTHMVTTASIVSVGCLLTKQDIPNSLIYIGVSAIGALLPDIDKENSIISKKAPLISKIVSKGGHRTYTHTLWSVLLMFLLWIIMYFSMPTFHIIFLSLAIGYTLHIIEDSFSYRGILWLYPLSQWRINQQTGRPYKKGHHNYTLYYRVGSRKETIIKYISLFVLVIMSGIIIYNHLPRSFTDLFN